MPFSALGALRDEPPSTRLLAIKAMLMSAAGLLSHVDSDAERREMRALLRLLPRSRRLSAGEWRLFRVRPGNHPARRAAGPGAIGRAVHRRGPGP